MITCLYRNKVDENIVSNILSCPQLGLLELHFAEGMLFIPNDQGTNVLYCSCRCQVEPSTPDSGREIVKIHSR